jgi:hypothetical protein
MRNWSSNHLLEPAPIAPVHPLLRLTSSPRRGSFQGRCFFRSFMKTIIALILSSVSVLAGDTNSIQVMTTISTNTELGTLVTCAVYTRDGQTNLVCFTHTKNGAVCFRNQNFYHNGTLVGGFMDDTKYSGTLSFGNAPYPYQLGFVFDNLSHEITSASIQGNGRILDTYECTNGIFYPADASLIRGQNGDDTKDWHTFDSKTNFDETLRRYRSQVKDAMGYP